MLIEAGNELVKVCAVVVRGEMSVGEELNSVVLMAGVELVVLNPAVVARGEACAVDQRALLFFGGGSIVRPGNGGEVRSMDGLVVAGTTPPKLVECQGSEANVGWFMGDDAEGTWMLGRERAMRLVFSCCPPTTCAVGLDRNERCRPGKDRITIARFPVRHSARDGGSNPHQDPLPGAVVGRGILTNT